MVVVVYVHDCPGNLCNGHLINYNSEDLGGFVYEIPNLFCQISNNALKIVSKNGVEV